MYGYKKISDTINATVLIYINLKPFKIIDNNLKTESRTKKVNDVEQQYFIYYFHGSAKFPVYLKMKNNKTGEILEDLFLKKSDESIGYKLTEYDNSNLAYQNNSNDIQEYAKNLFNENRYQIEIILRKYCPFPTSRNINLSSVSLKNVNYDDLDKAIDLCSEVFTNSSSDDIIPKENEANKLKQAIEIWENALAEADFNNKKARINEKVAMILYGNHTSINTILGNFDKAKEYSDKGKEIAGLIYKEYLKSEDKIIEENKHLFEINNIIIL